MSEKNESKSVTPPSKSARPAGGLTPGWEGGADPGEQVRKLFSDWGGRGGTPGAAVLVVRNGKVLHEEGYGLSELDGAQLGPETVFELASVSKQFTAMAVMILKEQGKLGYEDCVCKYFNFLAPEAKEATVLHLLNHRSGVPEYADIFTAANLIDRHYPRSAKADRGRFEPTSADVLLVLTKQYEFRFPPGARYAYSNSGYVLLANLIEQVSGESFPDFMRRHIFEPLGMESTFVYHKSAPAPRHATLGYDRGWSRFNEIDYTPLDYIYGDGSVQSNLTDLRRWIQALDVLVSPEGGAGATLPVKPETFREALLMAGETDTSGVDYAFGWFKGKTRGLAGHWHSGSWGGYRTMIMRFPDQQFTAVVLSNVAHLMPTFMSAQVATYYLEGEMEPISTVRVPVDVLRRFVKRYTDASGDYYDVTLEPAPAGGHALFLKYSTLDKFKLVPVGEDEEKFSGEFFIEGLFGFDAFRYTLDERKKIIHVPSRPKGAGHSQRQSPQRQSQAF